MNAVTNQILISIEQETRTTLPTDAAAHHLARKPQTEIIQKIFIGNASRNFDDADDFFINPGPPLSEDEFQTLNKLKDYLICDCCEAR